MYQSQSSASSSISDNSEANSVAGPNSVVNLQWVDLYNEYDEQLLTYFYDKVMKKYFPIEDEVEREHP